MKKIFELIQNLPRPTEGFNLISLDDKIWGIGPKGETIFGMESKNSTLMPIKQSTKFLKLYINYDFSCNKTNQKKLSLYILNSTDYKLIELFIRICNSMPRPLTEESLYKNFIDLKKIFADQNRPSLIELQGMFGELYAMYYLKTKHNIDISYFYQKEQKRKFDFSLADFKKIEIKTTLKSERIHHFLKEQLDVERYDIKIISILLQKDDKGLSLKKLIDKCKSIFSAYLEIVIYIELMIKNISEEELENIKFNELYINDHIKIYDAIAIPRIHEKTSEGVFNIEFDSDLSNIINLSIDSFKYWVNS